MNCMKIADYITTLKQGREKLEEEIFPCPCPKAMHTKNTKFLYNIPNWCIKKLFAMVEQNFAYMLSNYKIDLSEQVVEE